MAESNTPTVRQTTCGTLTVGTSFDASAVSIENCSLSPTQVEPGGTAAVSVTVSNDNESEALVQLVVRLDGDGYGQDQVTIPAGSTEDYTLGFDTNLDDGDYNVGVEIGYANEA